MRSRNAFKRASLDFADTSRQPEHRDRCSCLFDGHGGQEVSKFLQQNFAKFWQEILPLNYDNYQLFPACCHKILRLTEFDRACAGYSPMIKCQSTVDTILFFLSVAVSSGCSRFPPRQLMAICALRILSNSNNSRICFLVPKLSCQGNGARLDPQICMTLTG